MNDQTRAKTGEMWAAILGLKRDKEHRDRYKTSYGSKTALEIYHTITGFVLVAQKLEEQNVKQPFETHNIDCKIDVNGTCLQGYINISYHKLVEKFGEPRKGDDYKVDAEWLVKFADGTVATIYNYKDGKNYNGAEGLETEKITEWHIGGFSKKTVELVHNLFKENKNA